MHPALSGQSTTTSIGRHLKECRIYKRAQQSGSLSHLQFFIKRETKQEITQTYVNDKVLKFFISGNIPFNQAENKELQDLLSLIQVNGHPYDPPSRKMLRSNLTSWAELAKQELKKLLQDNDSKISLALDCWTSRRKQAFLGIY